MSHPFRRIAGLLSVMVMLGGGSVLVAEEKDPSAEHPISFWMDRKLDYSKEILAGIAAADFDKIVQNAQAMRGLSKVEAFVRARTPGYRVQLKTFEETTDEIILQAKKDNLEGAALAFTQLTISCVNCHKHLRANK